MSKHHAGARFAPDHWRYDPNFRASFGRSHREQEEAYVVVAGSGRMLLGDEVVQLKPWDVVPGDAAWPDDA